MLSKKVSRRRAFVRKESLDGSHKHQRHPFLFLPYHNHHQLQLEQSGALGQVPFPPNKERLLIVREHHYLSPVRVFVCFLRILRLFLTMYILRPAVLTLACCPTTSPRQPPPPPPPPPRQQQQEDARALFAKGTLMQPTPHNKPHSALHVWKAS